MTYFNGAPSIFASLAKSVSVVVPCGRAVFPDVQQVSPLGASQGVPVGTGGISRGQRGAIVLMIDDDNFGARRSLNVDGRPHNHAILKFPNIFGNGADQIPLGSTINNAALTLNVSNSTDRDPTVYRIIESWTESEVTWSSRSDDVEWSNDGADGTGSHAATPVGDFPMRRSGSQSMDVTTSLRSWSNGEINEGWVLKDNSNNGADFDSSETRKTGERPKLTVNYTPP